MTANIVKLLDEVDAQLRTRIQSAANGLRYHEERACAEARDAVQKAITLLIALR